MRTLPKNNQSGFSLVELMVVVAIIGILATVAIPSVSKYMAKARQSEVKTNLASLFSANKAFFVEYSGYGTHFAIIGHAPEGQLRYNYGFPTPAAMTVPRYQSINYNGGIPAAALGGAAVNSFTACDGTNRQNVAALSAAGAVPFRCVILREGRLNADPAGAMQTLIQVTAAQNPTGAVLPIAVTDPAAGVNAAFTAAGGAVLDTSNPARVDRWFITQDKVMGNYVPGI